MSSKSGRFSSCSKPWSLAERASLRRWWTWALLGTNPPETGLAKYLPGSSRSHGTIDTYLATPPPHPSRPEIRMDCGVQSLLAPPKALNVTLYCWRVLRSGG